VYDGRFSLHLCQSLLFIFLTMTNLTGVRWNLSVLLICSSNMAKDVGHFSMCLLPFVFPLRVDFCIGLLLPSLSRKVKSEKLFANVWEWYGQYDLPNRTDFTQ
jgi:hypothetical protein